MTRFDMLMFVVFMSIVVGLAALVLKIVDWFSLPKGVSHDEKKALVAERTQRWQLRWRTARALMAAVSLPLNVLALKSESGAEKSASIAWIIVASVYLLFDWRALPGMGGR